MFTNCSISWLASAWLVHAVGHVYYIVECVWKTTHIWVSLNSNLKSAMPQREFLLNLINWGLVTCLLEFLKNCIFRPAVVTGTLSWLFLFLLILVLSFNIWLSAKWQIQIPVTTAGNHQTFYRNSNRSDTTSLVEEGPGVINHPQEI